MLTLNEDLLIAKLFHGLKSIQTEGETLQPRFLEISIAESFGFKHVGDSAFYADGINDGQQISIKTRTLNPHILKTKEGRDFQSHPEKFIGPQVNQKHNRWINGIEIVQRRQQLDLNNDSTADPKKVGEETLKGFLENVQQSISKYQVNQTYEIIGVHGYDRTNRFYLMSLFWKLYEPLIADQIIWVREGYGVSGYLQSGDIKKKVCERINGNAKREATCFKEYKDLTQYENKIDLIVPVPKPWIFDQEQILNEIRTMTQ